MLICPKCGYDNELGRIFCHQCGQKLDLDAIKPPSRGGKSLKTKKGFSLGTWIRRAVGLALLLALLFVGYQMLQLPQLPSKPSDTEVTAAEKKWAAVERMVNSKKAGRIEASPAEVKAFLATVKIEKRDLKWGFVPERFWIDVQPGAVKVYVLATMRLGDLMSKQVCFSYTGVPKIQDGGFKFVPTAGAVGDLVWPPEVVKAIGFHQRVYTEIFQGLRMEQEVLSQLSQIEVQRDRIIFQSQAR